MAHALRGGRHPRSCPSSTPARVLDIGKGRAVPTGRHVHCCPELRDETNDRDRGYGALQGLI